MKTERAAIGDTMDETCTGRLVKNEMTPQCGSEEMDKLNFKLTRQT